MKVRLLLSYPRFKSHAALSFADWINRQTRFVHHSIRSIYEFSYPFGVQKRLMHSKRIRGRSKIGGRGEGGNTRAIFENLVSTMVELKFERDGGEGLRFLHSNVSFHDFCLEIDQVEHVWRSFNPAALPLYRKWEIQIHLNWNNMYTESLDSWPTNFLSSEHQRNIPTARPSFRFSFGFEGFALQLHRPTGNNSYANPSVLTNSVLSRREVAFPNSWIITRNRIPLPPSPPPYPPPAKPTLAVRRSTFFSRLSFILVFPPSEESI